VLSCGGRGGPAAGRSAVSGVGSDGARIPVLTVTCRLPRATGCGGRRCPHRLRTTTSCAVIPDCRAKTTRCGVAAHYSSVVTRLSTKAAARTPRSGGDREISRSAVLALTPMVAAPGLPGTPTPSLFREAPRPRRQGSTLERTACGTEGEQAVDSGGSRGGCPPIHPQAWGRRASPPDATRGPAVRRRPPLIGSAADDQPAAQLAAAISPGPERPVADQGGDRSGKDGQVCPARLRRAGTAVRVSWPLRSPPRCRSWRPCRRARRRSRAPGSR
jgi:hypothetical protein